MLGFLPTRAYRPGTPGATTFLSPLSGTFNYGWDSFRRTELTQEEVIAGLRSEALYKGEGGSHSARVAAWSWLGRHLAMFTDKSEVEFKGLADRIAAMSEDEVRELLELNDESIVAHLTASGATHAA